MFSVVRFTSLSLGFKFLQSWLETEKEKEQLLIETHNAELSFLRAQINPHFLLNVLNSIYGLSLKKSSETPNAFDELGSLFNYITKVSTIEQTRLSNEIEYIENYLKLGKRRVGEEVDIKMNFNIDTNYVIEPLLLITFIENAFKHGISMKNKSFIYISLEAKNGKLLYQVQNSYHGFIRKDNTSGIGLSNLKRRLDILYKNRYDLNIGQDGTTYWSKLEIKQL
jgi:LytS/YehU family sensor histidine kinase